MSLVKKIIVIAGPNGAGKTTFAREFLPTDEACLNFVNADLIAAGLSPFAPEPTLSGVGDARQIPQWQAAGYAVALHFGAVLCFGGRLGCLRQQWPRASADQ